LSVGVGAYAGFGRRLAAFLVDSLLTGVLMTAAAAGLAIPLAIVMVSVAAARTNEYGELRGEGAILVAAVTAIGALLIAAILLVLYLLYFVLFTAWRGQTPGKMLLSIRVVDATGQRPGKGRVLMREVVGKFLSGTVLYVGFLWPLWDSQHQAWHDKIAQTWVVKTSNDRG